MSLESTRASHRFWIAHYLLDDILLRACALFTVVFVLMPPDGLGVTLCGSVLLTGAPCPGCGVTRCGSNLVRGNVARAWRYHPIGVVMIPGIGFLGVLGVLPRRPRRAIRRRLEPWVERLKPLVFVGAGGFLLYGLVRWVGVVAGLLTWP